MIVEHIQREAAVASAYRVFLILGKRFDDQQFFEHAASLKDVLDELRGHRPELLAQILDGTLDWTELW